jgi:hypothetical protein
VREDWNTILRQALAAGDLDQIRALHAERDAEAAQPPPPPQITLPRPNCRVLLYGGEIWAVLETYDEVTQLRDDAAEEDYVEVHVKMSETRDPAQPTTGLVAMVSPPAQIEAYVRLSIRAGLIRGVLEAVPELPLDVKGGGHAG